jgi:hypothetical protein
MTFDGKRYTFDKKAETKREAEQKANHCRKMHGAARIVKHEDEYAIYVRNTK